VYPFRGSWNASILNPIVWRREVKAPYLVGTRKTLTSLSCIPQFTAFSRSEILMLLLNDSASALASSVLKRGRNLAKGLLAFCLIEYTLLKAFFCLLGSLYVAARYLSSCTPKLLLSSSFILIKARHMLRALPRSLAKIYYN
jgi:hypothetical protein